MAKRVPLAMRMPEGSSVADFDVSGGLAGLASGVMRRVGPRFVDSKMIAQLDEWLGQTFQMGQKVFRLSSFNPEKGAARLHDIATGERIMTPLTTLVQRILKGDALPGIPAPLEKGVTRQAVSSGERFLKYPTAPPSPTAAGTRIPTISEIGPRGGTKHQGATTPTVRRRPIPPTATR